MTESSRPLTSRRPIYPVIVVGLSGLVISGFWPGYFGPLLKGEITRPLVVHLHGAVFTGWLVLVLIQGLFASIGRLDLHRTVGNVGILYAGMLLIVGLIVSFAAPVLHIQAGEWTFDFAAGWMLIPLPDLLLFGAFFGLGLRYRSKPQVHKRLILAATVAIADAGVSRLPFASPNESPAIFLMLWLSPLLVLIFIDVYQRKREAYVTIIATALLVVAFGRYFATESELWLPIGRALLSPFV